ncbi:hypothetical protein [Ideonella sp.]|uniref:hypothetical protein n=1 Tax=Ideonella sp. TaxID=1929293 RepID=UPI0035AD827D
MFTRSIALSLVAFAGLHASPALAEEISCAGTLGAVSVDNVFVPDGSTCVMDLTRVKGSVVVGTGSTLYARSVRVVGNVQAEGSALVDISGTSSVGGAVQVVQGGGALIRQARITGDLQLESNRARVTATGNVVGGNLQAFQNQGGVVLRNNRIHGNLQCKANVPAPTGSGNLAASKEDQCARL